MLLALTATHVSAQDQQPEPDSRRRSSNRSRRKRPRSVHPYVPEQSGSLPGLRRAGAGNAGPASTRSSSIRVRRRRVHARRRPHALPVVPHNTLDVRASFTPSGYKRLEAEFIAPRLLARQASLSLVGGWREATQVGFYGTGTANSSDDRANYGFTAALRDGDARRATRPPRAGGAYGPRISEWQQATGHRIPAVGRRDLHAGDAARPRHVGHLPALVRDGRRRSRGRQRTTRGAAGSTACSRTTSTDHGRRLRLQAVGIRGDPARAAPSRVVGPVVPRPCDDHRHQGRPADSVLHAAVDRRRVLAARLRELAFSRPQHACCCRRNGGSSSTGSSIRRVFYDTGKVTAHARDLTLDDLRHDAGFGLRFHGPAATPVRIDFARGNEGFHIVFAASASF